MVWSSSSSCFNIWPAHWGFTYFGLLTKCSLSFWKMLKHSTDHLTRRALSSCPFHRWEKLRGKLEWNSSSLWQDSTTVTNSWLEDNFLSLPQWLSLKAGETPFRCLPYEQLNPVLFLALHNGAPRHCQIWYLSSEPWISPEYCQIRPPNFLKVSKKWVTLN